jgi:hypothetical protein
MKKTSIFLILFLTFLLTANAGYMIRSVSALVPANEIKNFTLSFDSRGNPIAAGSMYSSLVGPPNTECNSIVIVHANTNQAQIFPIVLGTETYPEDYHIEVKDFHYVRATNSYILCGIRGADSSFQSYAFVATIDASLSTMYFKESHDASIYYSIWGNFESEPTPQYYACGRYLNTGTIVQIDPTTLAITAVISTGDLNEYHKIIGKWNTWVNPRGWTLIASGRGFDSEGTIVGFTMTETNIFFTPRYSYYWRQCSEPLSLCAITDDLINDNHIILATSCPDVGVNLNHIDILQLQGTTYTTLRGGRQRHIIQDITSNKEGVSLAGYFFRLNEIRAWYGHLPSSTGLSTVTNNDFFAQGRTFINYKAKYDNTGKVYTGGYFEDYLNLGVLFSSPQEPSKCDNIYTDESETSKMVFNPFGVRDMRMAPTEPTRIPGKEYILPFVEICPDFTKEGNKPDFAEKDEKESKIATNFDYISLKDYPSGTNYQLYSITGQLIQTGITKPNISIANLNKGIYFLRLENGDVHKFIK